MRQAPSETPTGRDDAAAVRLRAMLDALGYGATQIIGGEDWQRDIGELLARLGTASEVSRVSLFEVHPGPDGRLVESCRYDWAEPGLAPISTDPRYRNIPLVDESGGDGLDDWSIRRQRGEVVGALRSETSGYTREVFEQQGTFSFISVPIHIEGRWWGFLGFDDCRRERPWGELEVELLRTAASIVAGAIRRARIQDQLRISEERYSLAVQGTEDGLWDWDIDAGTMYLSPRLYAILERGPQTMPAGIEGLSDLLPAAAGPSLQALLAERFAARDDRFSFEARIRPDWPGEPEGAARWAAVRGLIVYNGNRASRVVGAVHDITERKRAELALSERERLLEASRRLLREVVDAVPAVINVKDLESRYVLMNAFQGRLYGVDPQNAIGHTSAEFVGDRYGGQSRDLDRVVIETRRALPFSERDFVDVAGRAHTWYTAKMPLTGEGGALEGVVTVALDITELKANERARAHLLRYVTPSVAETLASTDEPFGPPREQEAAVLFADIVDSSRLFVEWPPERVFALLQEVHGIMTRTVFDNHGTLDKFIGDGVMATFGTPFAGPGDAGDALACAHGLQDAIGRWSRAREAAGERPIRIAVGVHYGPVLLGNLGDERRMEFAVIGDTVNVASRLERLARPLSAAIVVSDELVEAVRREARAAGAGAPAALDGLVRRGPQPIAGHDRPVGVWTAS